MMYLCYSILALIPLYISSTIADHLIGSYPAPIDISSNQSQVSLGWQNLSSTFDAYLSGKDRTDYKALLGVENLTFSVGMFSLHDPDAVRLQYHYTAPEIANAENGTNKVDANSIYRVASVSKLITTFAGMIELTQEDWNRPLPQIKPDFRDYLHGYAASDPIWTVEWDKVTPWSLATQLSGIPYIGLPLGDSYYSQAPATAGAPQLNISAWSPCVARLLENPYDQYCSAPESIASIKSLPPNFLPWTTPAYSDLNFMLLGIAISNITGKPISTIYHDAIFGPLGMTSSNDTHPTAKAEIDRSVIAGNPADNFALEPVITAPSGGILSTISDLQKLGIGILNSTLLPTDVTRKWMKPVSHTASFSYSVGAPWEIHRYVSPTTGKTTELYTKLGSSGYYGGALVLIPQYDAGFTMLNAWTGVERGILAMVVLDYVTNTILPALEDQSLAEAMRNYIGTYESTDPNLNASVTIGFNQSTSYNVKSDLSITQWIYNGTDVLAGPFFGGYHPRLELSIPAQAPTGSPGQVAFQLSTQFQTLTYMDAMQIPRLGVIGSWTGFYSSNGDFLSTDTLSWGGVGVGMFVFDVDGKGMATACTPAVDRLKLERTAKKS